MYEQLEVSVVSGVSKMLCSVWTIGGQCGVRGQ